MRCALVVGMLAAQVNAAWCLADSPEKDVSWRAQAEIARRGALVERVAGQIAGFEDAASPAAAFALAMQPPEDDSHKWLFTLVTTRNCSWCEQARRDFQNDPKLKAWVDTKDYAKSWAHWQVVQIEDKSQEWRWKDFRPTSFPTLIVQPPVNGSWGDPHTIVFAHQGFLKPADLDAAIRMAIQRYAEKLAPRRLTSTGAATTAPVTLAGFQQVHGPDSPGGGWTPPVAPPSPLPPLPSNPNPAVIPPANPVVTPDVASLFVQLVSRLLGGASLANLLLMAILAWHIYRDVARREGIPLLLDDASAEQLAQLLQSALQSPPSQPTQSTKPNQQ
jgi:hypothetical protein